MENKLPVRPLGDRVIVKAAAVEEYKTAGGIIIPTTAQEKPSRGTIVAVGRGNGEEPMDVSVGEEVLYGKYAGTEIEWDGQPYLMMRQSDILCVI